MKDLIIIRSKQVFAQPRHFYFRVYKKEYARYKKWIEPNSKSKLPLDIIIPVVAKDLDVLPYAINSAKKHIKHPIGKIYVVAPNKEEIRNAANSAGAVFVDEKDVCSIAKNDINYIVNGVDRSGWIYQQVLKYNFTNVGASANFLVLDSDTFFIKDIVFESRGKFYFDFSDEYHEPYQKAYELLTAYKHSMAVSFVAHYMLFNKKMLKELVAKIEETTAMPLHLAIKSLAASINDQSAFSEYECYANYCLQHKPEGYKIRYWFNKSASRSLLPTADDVIANAHNYKSVSFHSHNL